MRRALSTHLFVNQRLTVEVLVPLQLELPDYGEFPQPLEKALESSGRLEELALTPQL
ncbi:MAG: hypothetical protein ACE5IP_03780 [Terriglobia bacterium]